MREREGDKGPNLDASLLSGRGEVRTPSLPNIAHLFASSMLHFLTQQELDQPHHHDEPPACLRSENPERTKKP